MTAQPHLFAPNFADRIDPTTQVSRLPGTADADCLCGYQEGEPCTWPFCDFAVVSSAVPHHESEET